MKGKPFDLKRYVDNDSVFISKKSKDGKDLKALELPGSVERGPWPTGLPLSWKCRKRHSTPSRRSTTFFAWNISPTFRRAASRSRATIFDQVEITHPSFPADPIPCANAMLETHKRFSIGMTGVFRFPVPSFVPADASGDLTKSSGKGHD